MRELICEKLRLLEQDEKVTILYACESGSRAWGFPSVDSDFDVRFIYVHPQDWYLSIDEGRDVIERALDDDNVDLSGWDLKKALRLFRKSNPPLCEWLRSPIVYHERFSTAASLRKLLPGAYSPIASMHHYLHMANGNFREYLRGDSVRLKKYFYVLRPVLACSWIVAGHGVVPMELRTLVDRMLPEGEVKNEVLDLLERKMAGEELDSGPQIPALSRFLESELLRLENAAQRLGPASQQSVDLSLLFRNTLRETATCMRN